MLKLAAISAAVRTHALMVALLIVKGIGAFSKAYVNLLVWSIRESFKASATLALLFVGAVAWQYHTASIENPDYRVGDAARMVTVTIHEILKTELAHLKGENPSQEEAVNNGDCSDSAGSHADSDSLESCGDGVATN